MYKFQLGSKVTLAAVQNIEFKVMNINADGSFEIEAILDQQNIIKYGNVSQEMLRLVVNKMDSQ